MVGSGLGGPLPHVDGVGRSIRSLDVVRNMIEQDKRLPLVGIFKCDAARKAGLAGQMFASTWTYHKRTA